MGFNYRWICFTAGRAAGVYLVPRLHYLQYVNDLFRLNATSIKRTSLLCTYVITKTPSIIDTRNRKGCADA